MEGQSDPTFFSLSSCTGWNRLTPWTSGHFIAGPHGSMLARITLEFPIDLTCKFLDCGRNLKNLEKTKRLRRYSFPSHSSYHRGAL